MSTNKNYLLKKAKIGTIILPIDGLFFGFVSPTNSNSFVVIGGCLLLALTFYAFLALLTELVAMFIPITRQAQKRLALFATLLLTFLLIMQSIGQLGLRDVLAITALVVVLYFYLTYISRNTSPKLA